MNIDYKHSSGIQIRFKDIDKLGHVNNANFLSYFEIARVNYFRDVIGKNPDWKKEGMILAQINISFKCPVVLEDEVYVYTCVSKLGNKSFEISNRLVKMNESGEEIICCEAQSTIVCFNYKENKSIEIPHNWLDKILKFDKYLASSPR